MWTAKRVLIMVFGIFLCLSGFAVYSLILGSVDGMQPLEEKYLPAKPGPGDAAKKLPEGLGGEADKRLVMAFGPFCKELQRPLRLWLSDKHIAFAAGEFNIDKSDGRVKLAPFSAAIFHKSSAPGGFPEISTITCDMAILTMDRNVAQYSDLSSRKVIAVELIGQQPGITLTNNRRTIEKNDDIDVLITNGNVFWEERQNKIWSEGVVCLTDKQTKPHTVIRGQGLDLFLAKDSNLNQPKNAKPQPASASNEYGNVEVIKLRSDVEMHFWVEASSGFLGGTQAKKKDLLPAFAAQDAAAPEKAHINIRTPGSFVYDLTKEFAWFESPPAPEGNAGYVRRFSPEQVHVQRQQKVEGKEKYDQLTCDRLDLQFRRKLNPAGALLANQSSEKEIETAKAIRRGLTPVVLSLDSDGMAAYASEMFYRAGSADEGPLTILKGEPLKTFKDGHKLVCKELHLFAANRFGAGQRAWAQGPGEIDLLDPKNPEKNTFPTHVLWRDTLTITKEIEGAQVFDLMVVTGEASFIDDLQKQELHGEKISVWMLQLQEGTKRPEAVGGPRQELHRVLAQNRVRARAPAFIVRRSDSLTLMFIPEAARGDRLPDLPVTVAKPAPGTASLPPMPVDNKTPSAEPKPKPKIPIELEGNKITVAITTLGSSKQLQELIAKGNVYVFQAGEKAGEKALEITGTLLTLNHADKGDLLVVYGDTKTPARLEVGDSIIWGPKVTVDQATNHADVEGAGGMDIPSNKKVDGSVASSKAARIRINWNKNMTFEGDRKFATFYGGVQATEKGARSGVLCQTLHIYLDKPVSFREGQKDKQDAKIDRMVFERNVFIDDTKVDEKQQFVQRTIMEGRELINYDGGLARLVGPGTIRNLGKGAAEQGVPPPPGVKTAPAKMEWKLTHVKFRESMHSNSADGNKKATFYGHNEGVEVFHFPTIKIEEKMNPDSPPLDGLYLRCGILVVEGKQAAERTTHIMIARENVTFRTDKYLGYADIVKFDEVNDIVIFEGINGNLVRMYQVQDGKANANIAVRSAKVLYNRKTGKIDTEGVQSISN